MRTSVQIAVTGLAMAVAPWGAAADWPSFRGPDQNRVSTETGWTATWDQAPKVLWKAQIGAGMSGVTVSEGKAYTMGWKDGKDTVTCLDANTGKPIWQHSYAAEGTKDGTSPDYDGPRSTPTVDGSLVYSLSRDGQLFALDAATGAVKWSKDLRTDPGAAVPDWGFCSSPLVLGNMLIINAGDNGLALDKTTGAVIWKSGNGEAGYSTPTVYERDGKKILAFSNAAEIMGVDAATGKVVWRYPWKTPWKVNASDLTYSDGKIFVSSGYNVGCALLDVSGAEPKLLWQNTEMRNMFHSSILYKGSLYGVDDDQDRKKGVKCIDFATGAAKWAAPQLKYCGLTIADGKLIIVTERGELVIAEASPDKYTELARTQILGGETWTDPVLANGRVYARNRTGDLVCVDLKK